MSGTTSMTLLEGARDSKPGAWERLVDVYAPLIRHWVRSRGTTRNTSTRFMTESDVDDLCQNVFVRIWPSLNRFERGKEGQSFRAWLRQAADWTVADFFRDERDPNVGDLGIDFETTPAPLDAEEEESARTMLVNRVIELLKTRHKPRTFSAWHMVRFEEREAKSVMAELGMTRNQVDLAVHRLTAQFVRYYREIA